MGKKRLSGWPAVRGAGVLTVAILALGGAAVVAMILRARDRLHRKVRRKIKGKRLRGRRLQRMLCWQNLRATA